MPNNTTWIIVANSSEGRIFKLVKFPQIEEIAGFIHPESHLHNQDLISSKPGRTFQSTNTNRSAYEPKTSPKELEIEKFAKILSEHLSQSHQKGLFHRLYIFAEASFLGLLRQHLDDKTKHTIIAETPKDLTKHKIGDIEKNLAEATL